MPYASHGEGRTLDVQARLQPSSGVVGVRVFFFFGRRSETLTAFRRFDTPRFGNAGLGVRLIPSPMPSPSLSPRSPVFI